MPRLGIGVGVPGRELCRLPPGYFAKYLTQKLITKPATMETTMSLIEDMSVGDNQRQSDGNTRFET